MDHQITAVIVNRRENKLKKGYGYHLDLLVVSIARVRKVSRRDFLKCSENAESTKILIRHQFF